MQIILFLVFFCHADYPFFFGHAVSLMGAVELGQGLKE
jgi:hypothetical protein